jgi:hypothetical protein
VGDNFFEKKAKGCQALPCSCWRTPPTWLSEASNANERTAPGAPEEVCERFQNSGYAGKKSAIKIYQAEKPLELPQVRGGWEAVNSLHMAGKRDNTTLTHHVPQELDGGGRESALGRINGESIFLQDFKE